MTEESNVRGKLIAIYGVNNLGKSTQAKAIAEKLRESGKPTEYYKYPLYDVSPSGPLINGYLRNGNPFGFTPREFQIIQILNRTQFDHELREKLASGTWCVVEDYSGTGIGWGIGAGVDEGLLKELNAHLIKEDASFLLDGERFLESREKGHLHEENDSLMETVRDAHLKLAREEGWFVINANQSREEVFDSIWRFVEKLINA